MFVCLAWTVVLNMVECDIDIRGILKEMSMKSIAILAASNGKNLELSEAFKRSIEDHPSSVSAHLIDLVECDLPLYSPLEESRNGISKSILDILPIIQETSAYIVVSPEYNGGLPPTLNNMIAWVSRATNNWRDAFNGKPAAIASFSGSGTNILQMMRLQLAYVGMNVIGRQLLANGAKPANPDSIQDMTNQLVTLI